MKHYGLFKEIVEATRLSNSKNFTKISVMATEYDEQQRMKKAKEIEEDGYIKLIECHNRDSINDAKAVTLKGYLTDKGIKEAEK